MKFKPSSPSASSASVSLTWGQATRRSCLVLSSVLISSFTLASLFVAIHITTYCPVYLGSNNHRISSNAQLQDCLHSTEHTRDALHSSDDTTWQPWELPRSLLEHFPSQESAKLDPRRFQLQIKLLTYDRIGPASRFLKSLQQVNFLGDRVDLEIFLDHPFSGARGWANQPPAKQEEAMKTRKAMLEMLDNLTWPHGPKTIHNRAVNSGIQPQWMEAWWPEHVNQFAFIAEDDTEVSPFFYVYFKRLIMFYYYNQSNFDPSVYGISFQRQWLVPGYYGNSMVPPNEPFLYPLVGTWGQFVFPILWKDYRIWYDENRYKPGRDPSIGSMRTTLFWKKKGNAIWTPWQVQWAYVRHVYNMYTGFPRNLSLSVSHRTSGVNHKKSLGADAVLMIPDHLPLQMATASTAALQSSLPAQQHPQWWTVMPASNEIKKFDFCFRRIPTLRKPVRSIKELQKYLPMFDADKEVAILPVPGTEAAYQHVRNWLCFLEGLNRHNYLILLTLLPSAISASDIEVPDTGNCLRALEALNSKAEGMAQDLAARGHLVYVMPAEGKLELGRECTQEVLNARRGSILSLSQAKLMEQVLGFGTSVLVNSLGSAWKKDPFNCLHSFPEGEQEAFAWVLPRPVPSSAPVVSVAIWVPANEAGKASFRRAVALWEADGVPELGLLSAATFVKMEQALNAVRLSQDGGANVKGDLGACVSASKSVAAKSGLPFPAILLLEGGVQRLKERSMWLVDDVFFACKAVTCKKM